jgi:LacI family transcriptional regulator
MNVEEGARKGRPGRKSTVKDVAEAARVSISSVSRVINGYPGVHPTLHARVMRAVEEVEYVLPAARGRPQQSRRKAIYFILANRNLHIPFHSKVLQALENKCAEQGDLLLYRSLRYSPETPPEDLRLAEELQLGAAGGGTLAPDGIILTGTTYPNFLEALRQSGIPFVLLGNNYSGAPLEHDAVYFDGAKGAHEATRYLIELGHRSIFFIGDTSLSWYSIQYAGYSRAIEERGLEPLAQVSSLSDSYYSNGYLSVELMFQQSRHVTAILAGYDEVALGAWKALDDRKLAVPRDLSLIGFDDEDYAAFTVPPLTTVRIDVESIGNELIRLLYRKMQAPDAPHPSVKLPTVLVKRSTCWPVSQA